MVVLSDVSFARPRPDCLDSKYAQRFGRVGHERVTVIDGEINARAMAPMLLPTRRPARSG